jgi:hypothetical protein
MLKPELGRSLCQRMSAATSLSASSVGPGKETPLPPPYLPPGRDPARSGACTFSSGEPVAPGLILAGFGSLETNFGCASGALKCLPHHDAPQKRD